MRDRQKFTRFLRKHIEISLVLAYIFDVLIATVCGIISYIVTQNNYGLAFFLTVLVGAELIYASKLVFSRLGMTVEISENLYDLLLIAQKQHPGIVDEDILGIEKTHKAHFCPECGTRYSSGYKCPSCGYTELKVKE